MEVPRDDRRTVGLAHRAGVRGLVSNPIHARPTVRAGNVVFDARSSAVASWWGLAPLARRWSGWGDPDYDRVFGDFTNGA